MRAKSVFVELIALLVGHDGNANADQHGREHQYKDAALEGGNLARAGAGGLRVAKRAILRVCECRNGKSQKQRTCPAAPFCGVSNHRFPGSALRQSISPELRVVNPFPQSCRGSPFTHRKKCRARHSLVAAPSLPARTGSMRKGAHVEQAIAVRPNHVHHEQHKNRRGNQR